MLEVKKLAKSYNNRLLFKNINFEIFPHSIHLLEGANGAGKSTLFKILIGLVNSDAGEIKTKIDISEVGYLAHATFLYPQLTALENLRFWHNTHTQKNFTDEEYINILEIVGLARFAHEQVRIFSRGMAQKLNIARLIAQKPKLYLLDEPSTGLDTQAKNFLITHIQDAKKAGSAIFWISHDKEQDRQYADYIHLLENKTLATINTEENINGVRNV